VERRMFRLTRIVNFEIILGIHGPVRNPTVMNTRNTFELKP